MEDNFFKLDIVSYTAHFNGYLDRFIDVRSRNLIQNSDGLNYRYTCRYPYKNFIEQSSQFVIRVETDLKLNLKLKKPSDEAAGSEELFLIQETDTDQIKQKEVHFIMFEGLINQHDMGLFGFIKMLWKSKKSSILPPDGKWQVSDFDHFMKGNPHDMQGMKAAFGKVPQPPEIVKKNDE